MISEQLEIIIQKAFELAKNKKHEFLSEWDYFANADGLEVKVIDGETTIC